MSDITRRGAIIGGLSSALIANSAHAQGDQSMTADLEQHRHDWDWLAG